MNCKNANRIATARKMVNNAFYDVADKQGGWSNTAKLLNIASEALEALNSPTEAHLQNSLERIKSILATVATDLTNPSKLG